MYQFTLIPKEDIYSIIPLLRIANSKLSEETLQQRLDEMVQQGYECVGVFDKDKLTNDKGQKFWLNEGYKILGFHFQKKLATE